MTQNLHGYWHTQNKYVTLPIEPTEIVGEYLHSEVLTMLRSAKSGRKVTDLYIARVDKQGNIKNAKPCVICQAMITSEFPTLNVHYTEENSG